MSKSEQIIQYTYYEKTVLDNFELIFNRLIVILEFSKYPQLKDECINTFSNIRKQMRKGTKFRSPKKLGPAIVYMVLKSKGFDVQITNFIEKIGLNRKEFIEILKQATIFYPSYFKRDRKTIVVKKINVIKEYFEFENDFLNKSHKILKKFWHYIKNTKEDVIVGVVCILALIAIEINDIPYVQICKKIGIKMSTVNYQVKNKIFNEMNISGFESLKKSSNKIRKLINKII